MALAQFADIVEARRALEDQRVATHHRPAFPRRNGFVDLEAEDAAIAHGAHRPAFVGDARALRAVFEHLELVSAGNFEDGVHIGRFAQNVDGHDDFRARRDVALDIRRVEVHGVVNFREHRQGACVNNSVVAGVPSPSGENHLVARAYSERHHRRHQRRRAGSDSDRVFGVLVFGEFSFEVRALVGRLASRIAAPPAEGAAVVEHLDQFAAFVLVVISRAGKPHREHSVAHRRLRWRESAGLHRSPGIGPVQECGRRRGPGRGCGGFRDSSRYRGARKRRRPFEEFPPSESAFALFPPLALIGLMSHGNLLWD